MYENANNNKDLKLDNHLFEEKYKMKGVKLLFIKNQAQNCQMPMSVGFFFFGGGGQFAGMSMVPDGRGDVLNGWSILCNYSNFLG